MEYLKPKYSALIFDFDNTLCNINTFTSQIKINDINEIDKTVKLNNSIIPIFNLFNDYNIIIKLFNDLKSKGVKLIIASFGNINIITKLLNIAFPNIFDYILTSDNINKETNTNVFKIFRHIVDPSCPNLYGKNIMLKKVINKFNINDPSKILFFDDDFSNTYCSSNINIDNYNNTNKGINSKILLDHAYVKYSKPTKYVSK